MAREALAEARSSVWNLRSPQLDQRDLDDALRDLVVRPLRPGLQATFEQKGDPWPLPPTVESALLRVCQEALANVAKHAEATHVAVTLEYAPEAVSLCVRDNGVGFGTSAAPQAQAPPGPFSGFGLVGMRERIAALGGTLDLRDDHGAEVRAAVPRPQTAAEAA